MSRCLLSLGNAVTMESRYGIASVSPVKAVPFCMSKESLEQITDPVAFIVWWVTFNHQSVYSLALLLTQLHVFIHT